MATDFDSKDRKKENVYDYLKKIYPKLSESIEGLRSLNKDSVVAKDLQDFLEINETSVEPVEGDSSKRKGSGGRKGRYTPLKKGKRLDLHKQFQDKDDSQQEHTEYVAPPNAPEYDTLMDKVSKMKKEDIGEYNEIKKEVREDVASTLFVLRNIEKSFYGMLALKFAQYAKTFNKKYPKALEGPIKFKVEKFSVAFPALKKAKDYTVTMDLDIQISLDIPKVTKEDLKKYSEKIVKAVEKSIKSGKLKEGEWEKLTEGKTDPEEILRFLKKHASPKNIDLMENKLGSLDDYRIIERDSKIILKNATDRIAKNLNAFSAIVDAGDFNKTDNAGYNKSPDKIGIKFQGVPILTADDLITGFFDTLIEGEDSKTEGKKYANVVNALKGIKYALNKSLNNAQEGFDTEVAKVSDEKYPVKSTTDIIPVAKENTITYKISKTLSDKLQIPMLFKN